MAWQGIEGHDTIVERFRLAVGQGRLPSAFLFVGPGGIGKRTFAIKLAQSLLCTAPQPEPLHPCGQCPSCQQVLAGTHPDLEQISKPKGKSTIPLQLLIGDKEHRMREGLCARIAMKPVGGGHKIAIIDDADALSIEGANCLLKTLEEPPPNSVLILIGTSPQRQLPTIRSRCQLVTFHPLSTSILERLLIDTGRAPDAHAAQRIATLAEGSLARAAEVADEEVWEFRKHLYETLQRPGWSGMELAKEVIAFVDAAGTDAASRRERQRCAIGFATDFFRHVARAQVDEGLPRPPGLDAVVMRFVADWSHGPEAAALAVDRCVLAAECVTANANQATNLESWLDDLATICRTGTCQLPEVESILG